MSKTSRSEKLERLPEATKQLRALVFSKAERFQAYEYFYELGFWEAVEDALNLAYAMRQHNVVVSPAGETTTRVKSSIEVPEWLFDAAKKAVTDRLAAGEVNNKLGRPATSKNRQRDFARFLTVEKLRNQGMTFEEACHALTGVATGVRSEDADFKRACRKAGKILPHLHAAGSVHTIKASYNRVSKALNDPDEISKYYPPRQSYQ